MKVVILAGGLGTRLSEETQVKPKPMVEIGGMPILLHIMKIYSTQGFSDFVLALGYKGEVIKDYFINYHVLKSDVIVNIRSGKVNYTDGKHGAMLDNITATMMDTGDKCLTGGRLKRLEKFLRSNGTFMMTYGDGVSNVDVKSLLKFHKKHGRIATVTAVRPPARFGTMSFKGDEVTMFKEKPQAGEGWINGGYFVFEPAVFDYIAGDSTALETEPLENLARDRQLMAFKHEGFWQAMDTVRDRDSLNDQWNSGKASWKIW